MSALSTERMLQAFRQQAKWCEELGSPFTARLLDALVDDWNAGGPLRELLPDWEGDATADALPLRVAGALHAMVLSGRDEALASVYPPRAAHFDAARVLPALREALRQHGGLVREYLGSPPQTNEIGRSALLLGGYAVIAHDTGLPLATLEMGASAGLNMLWHRYRYELGSLRWGDPASPVLIRSSWRGPAPALPERIAVTSYAGCDIEPIDLHAPGAALRLSSYVWADQQERLTRLRGAIALAQAERLSLDRSDGASWVEKQLEQTRPGVTTVFVHSIVWQYLGEAAHQRIERALAEAGARATPQAPVAWLRLEPSPAAVPQLQLTLWPGGTRRVLATTHPHGTYAHWQAAGVGR